MPIKVTCPKCQGVLHAPDDAGGKRGKCPTCGTVLAIPSDAPRATNGNGGGDPPAGATDSLSARPTAGFGARLPDAPEVPGSFPTRGSSSFGAMPPATKPASPVEERKPTGPGRPLPSTPQPVNQAGPFAKSGRGPAPVGQDPEAAERLAKAWRRSRRGLFWVQFGGFLFLLSWLGLFGLTIASLYGVEPPSKTPGYLGYNELPSGMEITYGVVIGPVVLGALMVAVGMLGYSGMPKRSLAKGTALLAAISTLIGFVGFLMFAIPTVGAILFGQKFTRFPDDLLHADDVNGVLQRCGLYLLLVFGILAKMYFLGSAGRVAAHLGNDSLARRTTKRAFFAGCLIVAISMWYAGQALYPKSIQEVLDQYLLPQWDKVGEHKQVVLLGLYAFLGFAAWLLYTRHFGAVRRAISEWLEQNDPAA